MGLRFGNEGVVIWRQVCRSLKDSYIESCPVDHYHQAGGFSHIQNPIQGERPQPHRHAKVRSAAECALIVQRHVLQGNHSCAGDLKARRAVCSGPQTPHELDASITVAHQMGR